MALACHWERAIGGFGGQVWTGVRTSEIEAAMRIRRTPPAERGALLDQVRLFVAAARVELNRLEAKQANEAGGK